jgi:hypothetical protein
MCKVKLIIINRVPICRVRKGLKRKHTIIYFEDFKKQKSDIHSVYVSLSTAENQVSLANYVSLIEI